MMESTDISTTITHAAYYRSGRRATYPQEFCDLNFGMTKENCSCNPPNLVQPSGFGRKKLSQCSVLIKNGHDDRRNSVVGLTAKILSFYYGVKKKFDDEIFAMRKAIFLFLLDWFLDFGTSIYHFSQGNWVSGTLTYLIVIFAGVVTTVGFLKDSQTRRYLQKDTYSIGLWMFILLHFPSWFPFVCLYMRLTYLRQEKDCEGKEESETKEKVSKYTDLVLQATWLETVLESKPQALLQTILLLETDATFTTIQDYLPLILSLWSVYSITGNIYAIVRAEAKEDKTETISKFYGYTYTVLSNLAPAMCISTMRNFYETTTEKFFAFLATIAVYYVALHIVERISLILANISAIDYGKVFHFIVTILFLLCLIQWITLMDNSNSLDTDAECSHEHSHEQFHDHGQFHDYEEFHDHEHFVPRANTLTTLRSQIVTGIFLICLVANVVFFCIAREFAEVSFKLKNDLVKEQSEKFKRKIKSLCKLS